MSIPRKPRTPDELLESLIGDRLVSVSFVLNDYVQLQFDEASMNIEVFPRIVTSERTWSESELGYADVFRRLGGQDVIAASERMGDGLRITFGTGQIHIDPAYEEIAVEIATLRVADSRWMCWRPGEGPFRHLG
ncbi:hypothetical protein [uncultured Propionibacterium sp.]|uniref:hypothetical protein n=1 Tax=uncultured Propionibacterium sp. TaxID=218066 RepID=UPI00292FBA0A|nr:hypothetical protein [uncultured Propionibacterium sp.]